MGNAVVKQEGNQELAKAEPATPATLLAMAVQQNADLTKLEKLMELKERWEANEARKAFVAAMAAFKVDPPDVYKTKTVSFNDTFYKHALLEDAAEKIGAALTKHGISFRWDCEQLDGGVVRVTCVLTHVMGHSERVSLQAGLDQSGKKNNIQALGSTISYLERYTLFAATGLAAKGQDDDGAGEYITEEQAADLLALITEVGANKEKFLAYLKVESLGRIPAKSYQSCVKLLEAKRKT